MKNRLLSITLALVLGLTLLVPAKVLAAKPGLEEFAVSGTISYITPGKVLPAGKTGKWVVVERELGGVLSGDISGPFTMNYKAIIESLLTQAGTLHGKVTVGDDSYVLKINGRIEPLDLVPTPADFYLSPEDYPPLGIYIPAGTLLPKLTISGQWRFTNGTWGGGDFGAWAIFIPTPENHVGLVLFSDFTMTGEWQR